MSRFSFDLINDVIHNLPHSETERFGDCKPDSIGLFQAQLLQTLKNALRSSGICSFFADARQNSVRRSDATSGFFGSSAPLLRAATFDLDALHGRAFDHLLGQRFN